MATNGVIKRSCFDRALASTGVTGKEEPLNRVLHGILSFENYFQTTTFLQKIAVLQSPGSRKKGVVRRKKIAYGPSNGGGILPLYGQITGVGVGAKWRPPSRREGEGRQLGFPLINFALTN